MMDMDCGLQNEMAENFREAQDRMARKFEETQDWMQQPHVYMRPRIYKDGDAWCCLYGDDIATGVCGFGSSPNLACVDFDKMWWHGGVIKTPAPAFEENNLTKSQNQP